MKGILTMKRIILILACLLIAGSVSAQTATTTTTLSSALTTGAGRTVVVASATGVAAQSLLFIDGELMTVQSVSSTTAQVARGAGGTAAVPHAANAIVYVATQAQAPYVFLQADKPQGACTSTNEQFLPQVNSRNGNIWDCPSALGLWVNMKDAIVINCRALLIADMVDQSCFIADRPYAVAKITEVHAVKEASGTLTLIPRKNTGTQAPASGVALSSALDMAAAATVQTVRTATLTTTPADLLLSAGNRISLDFTDDTAGELADVTVTFTLALR